MIGLNPFVNPLFIISIYKTDTECFIPYTATTLPNDEVTYAVQSQEHAF